VATGPAEPFAGEKTRSNEHESAPGPATPEEAAVEFAREVNRRQTPSGPWRLSNMMYLIAGAAVLVWLAMLAADSAMLVGLFVVGGTVFLFASVMGTGIILARRRSTRQDALLSVLAIAAEREMPLAPAVDAFADQYRGGSFRRITNLADQLSGGASVGEALTRSRTVVSRDALLLARVGQESGRLPRALRMAATTRSTALPIWTAISARLSYILALLLAMQSIVTFILYFVMPKFEAIFNDFNTSLPAVTVGVIDASHVLVKFGFITIWIPIIELALLLFLPFSFLSWGNFAVPVFDRMLGRRHTALILRSLGLFVDGGKPIAVGLSTLARHYPAAWVRRRLIGVESDVQHGADWIESLSRHRLIRGADADVLASAAEVGNLAWALFELAETAERRLATRFQIVIQTLFPLVVVMLGMAVFILAMAYFVPLVQLITELTRQ
jgi:type II secretory pathway component PulF